MYRILFLFSVFFGLCAYILMTNLWLEKEIKDLERKKAAEFRAKITQEQEAIRKGLHGKYRIDMASFEAMHKRLEIEKQKTKELQEQINELSSGGLQ